MWSAPGCQKTIGPIGDHIARVCALTLPCAASFHCIHFRMRCDLLGHVVDDDNTDFLERLGPMVHLTKPTPLQMRPFELDGQRDGYAEAAITRSTCQVATYVGPYIQGVSGRLWADQWLEVIEKAGVQIETGKPLLPGRTWHTLPQGRTSCLQRLRQNEAAKT